VTVTVPVGVVHVGCVTVNVGTAGADGAAFIVTDAVDVHPAAFSAVIVYVFGVRPANVVPVVVLMLYVIPATGLVIVTVPVGVVHVGCVTVNVGTAGADGAAFIVNEAVDVHPTAFSAVTV
jgi:hypothetical protein